MRPTFDEKHRAKATSTGRDTPQRARLSNTKMEITCLMCFGRLLLEVIFYGKFFLNLTDQMLFGLFFGAFCLTFRGHKAGLFTHIDFLLF